MSAQHVDDLLDLEALGALSPEESAFVRAHAADCAPCRASLEAAEGVAARLALAAPLYRAPAGLRERVLAELDAPPAEPARRTNVVTMAPRQPSAIMRFNRRWGAVAASVLIVPLAGLLAWALILQNQVNDLKPQSQQLQQTQGNLVVLASGIRARFTPTQDAGSATGSVVWSPEEGKCSVSVAGLPRQEPVSYHVFYQGWRGIEDAGELKPDEAGRASLVFDASRWKGDTYDVWVAAVKPGSDQATALLQASLRR